MWILVKLADANQCARLALVALLAPAQLGIWQCRPAMASMYSGVMEGSGEDVAAWLTSPAFEARLFTCFPCTNIIPSSANQVPLPLPLPCPALG